MYRDLKLNSIRAKGENPKETQENLHAKLESVSTSISALFECS